MKKNQILPVFLFLFSCSVFSQTGPAGIGTSATNIFWLKAGAGASSSTNNTPISFWNDQSGNGFNMAQAVTAQQPSFATNVINGSPAIQFDNASTAGQNDKMLGPDSPLLDNTDGYSFFTVTRPQNLGGTNVIVSKRTTVSVDQSFMLFYYTANKMHIDVQTTNDRFNGNTVYANNTNYIIDLIYDGNIPNPRCSLYVGETFDLASNETSSFVPDNASPIILGTTDATDPRPFGGYMAEVIIYREALSPAKRIIVNNYLSAKYNIALSANDKYAGDNSGNGDYDLDVAGVGQESTGSSTSFSASASAGMGITVSSGLDNGDYILAGHAVANNSVITTDVAGMSGVNNARWLRIWYVDVTNTLTAMSTSIQFDATDGGTGSAPFGATASDYVLLYRAGQSGSWTELATASYIVGDKAVFNGIALSADGYYTLGSKNVSASVLPVDLVSFDASANGTQVDLRWITASEKNNAYFTIEKSRDGQTFDNVAQVKGKGNSSIRSSYQETDPAPYQGLSYYRLKQTDTDNSSAYSRLVAVNFGSAGNNDLTIYPNPSEGIIYLDTHGNRDQDISVTLRDEAGKICLVRTWAAGKYTSVITLDTEGKLAKGSYVISVTAGSRSFSQTVIFK